jgi:beta-N-acetylhexosaminidase
VREDVGQLLWLGFDGPRVPSWLRRGLDAGTLGGTILGASNLACSIDPGGGLPQELCDLDALIALNRELHRAAPDGTPALIAIDQEGGAVQRIRAPATQWPPMRAHDGLEPPADAALAEQIGRALGLELRALGVDIDLAPVLDVHTNPANPVIGDRAFGHEPEAVARRALAFARGLAAAGVLPCGKHFPGHGDTHADSHVELPRVAHDRDRLARIELVPFARAAAAAIPMLMTAHVVFDALDPAHPATLSGPILTGLLRRQLGYRGVIISDDLTMRAIAGRMDPGTAAASAIGAGCDILLICRDESLQAAAEAGLIRAAERSAALRHRISESAARVRALKRSHAASLRRLPPPPPTVIGQFEHRRLADRLAGR